MLNKKSSGFAIWNYLPSLYFFAKGYRFYLFLLLNMAQFNTMLIKWCPLIGVTLWHTC